MLLLGSQQRRIFAPLRCAERLVEVGDDVVDVLDTDAEPEASDLASPILTSRLNNFSAS